MQILAKDENICSIERCAHGTIHIHFSGVSLRLSQDNFQRFTHLVNEATSFLLKESLFKTSRERVENQSLVKN